MCDEQDNNETSNDTGRREPIEFEGKKVSHDELVAEKANFANQIAAERASVSNFMAAAGAVDCNKILDQMRSAIYMGRNDDFAKLKEKPIEDEFYKLRSDALKPMTPQEEIEYLKRESSFYKTKSDQLRKDAKYEMEKYKKMKSENDRRFWILVGITVAISIAMPLIAMLDLLPLRAF